ncbi:MAG: CPBP family intramembrane glutamic endopeptidase [Fulvivirga sp.]
MNNFDNNYIHLSDHRSSITTVFLVFVLSLIGFYVVGPGIGFLFALPFYEGSLLDFQSAFANPFENPSLKTPIYIIQGMATLTGTIVVPLLYLFVAEKKRVGIFFKKQVGLLPILLSGIIVVTFMGVNSIVIDWNANISFPEFMSGFENWAKETEELAAKTTAYLTTFSGLPQFFLAFIVIAILPAVGEELLFRGFLQNGFHGITKNIHIAIWISAILFSTIHMQFYGFVPRMLLGALFGYLYYWSGNLFIPIFAHLVNNGLTLILFYLHDIGVIETDLTNTEAAPLYAVGIFAIITAALLHYFRNYFLKAPRTQ